MAAGDRAWLIADDGEPFAVARPDVDGEAWSWTSNLDHPVTVVSVLCDGRLYPIVGGPKTVYRNDTLHVSMRLTANSASTINMPDRSRSRRRSRSSPRA